MNHVCSLILRNVCVITLSVLTFSSSSLAADAPKPATPAATTTRATQLSDEDTKRGDALYKQHCSGCHDNPSDRIPHILRFSTMTPHTVLAAMTTGVMQAQASALSTEEKRLLAILLSAQPFTAEDEQTKPNLCTKPGGPLRFEKAQWNGWGNSLENWRYQPTPNLKAADVPRLKLKWAYAYPRSAGKSNGQPTVIGNRLFVTSEAGTVYSLNAKTGCAYWTHVAESGVRTAVSIGPLPRTMKAKSAAYFGDGSASVYAVDAESGKRLWKTRVEAHWFARITGAPILFGDKLFVPVSSAEEIAPYNKKVVCCSFRGSVVAMNAYTGEVLWKTYVIDETPKPFKKVSVEKNPDVEIHGPAGAAIWSTPTIDSRRHLIYVATGNSYTEAKTDGTDAVIALNMLDGRIKWRNQVLANDNYLVACNTKKIPASCPAPLGPDFDFGASPILHTLPSGKQLVIAGQKSGMVYAFDPDSGARVWETRVGEGGTLGGIEYGMAADKENIYAAVADHLSKTGKPGMIALNASTGQIVWNTPAPQVPCTSADAEGGGRFGCALGQSAAATVIPGVVFSGAVNGRMRAYATNTGEIIWDYNAAIGYQPVNTQYARGGSFDGGGVTVVDGTLYMNSGYGSNLKSGNVLLAFEVDKKRK